MRELAESVICDQGLLRCWAWLPIKVEARCEGFAGLDRAFRALCKLGVEGYVALCKGGGGLDVLVVAKSCARSANEAVRRAKMRAEVVDTALSAGCSSAFRLRRGFDLRGLEVADHAYRIEPKDDYGLRSMYLAGVFEGLKELDFWVVVAFKPVKANGLLVKLKSFAVKRALSEELYSCRADVRDGGATRRVVDVEAERRAGRLREIYDALSRGADEGLWRATLYIVCDGRRSAIESALHACSCDFKVREVDVEDALRGSVRGWSLLSSSQLAKLVEPIFACAPSTLVDAKRSSPTLAVPGGGGADLGASLTPSEQPVGVFGIPVQNLTSHIAVFGSTGSGKSTTVRVLIHGFSKLRIPTLVLDWTGEHARVLPKSLERAEVLSPGLNLRLCLLPRNSSDQAVCEWIDQLDYCAQAIWREPLSPLQQRILFEEAKGLVYEGKRGARELLEALERRRAAEARRDWLQSIEALISRLRPLAASPLSEAFSSDAVGALGFFNGGGAVVDVADLSYLPSIQAKTVFAHLLLKRVYDWAVRLTMVSYPRLMVVVDEAHNLAPAHVVQQGILERFAEELRKYGVGLVAATLRPSMLSGNVVGSAATIICHRLSWPEDVEVVAKLPGFDRYANALSALPPGYAVVSTPNSAYRTPAYVKVGLPEHEGLVEVSNVDSSCELPGWARKALRALAKSEAPLRRRADLSLTRRQAELLRRLGYVELDGDLVLIAEKGRMVAESS